MKYYYKYDIDQNMRIMLKVKGTKEDIEFVASKYPALQECSRMKYLVLTKMWYTFCVFIKTKRGVTKWLKDRK